LLVLFGIGLVGVAGRDLQTELSAGDYSYI